MTTPLWNHQEAGVQFGLPLRGVMLACDMGTGKSRMALEILLGRYHLRTLLLCPLSVVGVWQKQVRLFAGERLDCLALNSGSVRRKQQQAAAAAVMVPTSGRPVLIVTNYETAWREPFASWALTAGLDCLVCDELHRAKSPSSRISMYLARLAVVIPWRIGLTGTPMPHSPLDVFAQYRILASHIYGNNYWRFRNRYAVLGGYERKEVVGFKDLDDLHEKFYRIAYRVEKKDVLTLPTFVHEEIPVKLSPKGERAYRQLEKTFRADLETGTVSAGNALVRLLRLQQATSGFGVTENGAVEALDHGKEAALTDLLTDLPPSEPCVVFARFTHDLTAVQACAKKIGRQCFELSGRVNELTAWQTDTWGSVLAVQIQAGGLGVEMVRACYAVFFSLGFSLAEYEQALARLHRPGQTRSVTYLHLVAERTADQKVYHVLRNRKEVVEGVLRLLREEKSYGEEERMDVTTGNLAPSPDSSGDCVLSSPEGGCGPAGV